MSNMCTEEYTLILKHELVYPDDRKIQLDEPCICKSCFIYGQDVPISYIVNEMLEKMKHFVLKKMEETN